VALTDLEDLLLFGKPPVKKSQVDPYNRAQYWSYAANTKEAFREFYLYCFMLVKPSCVFLFDAPLIYHTDVTLFHQVPRRILRWMWVIGIEDVRCNGLLMVFIRPQLRFGLSSWDRNIL